MEMKPEIKRTNLTQIVITIALLGILVAILALYIYYGMYQARQIATVPEVVPEPAVATSEEEARRNEIIEALNNQPIPLEEDQQREIINSLQQDPVEADTAESEQKRAEIIKALQQN
ncbi:MAG: hypothetical protein V4668_01570 [Patescibacteria group bacterium]